MLIPLSALVFRTAGLTWGEFVSTVTAPRVLASYRVTFGAAMIAAVINSIFGVLVAWVLVRYRFPGRRMVDALVDLPFALPTAVAGITLATIYSPNGWVGRFLEPHGIKVAFTPLGIVAGHDLHRSAFRGAHRSAGDRRDGNGTGRGRRLPGGQPLADPAPGDLSDAAARPS